MTLVVLVSLTVSGCLFSTDGGPGSVKHDRLYSDGDWTPMLPELPRGWPAMRFPQDNPYSSAKAVLGRRLFFETALSRDRSVSCASCHHPEAAFSDPGLTHSVGVHGLLTHRNSPTLANVVFGTSFLFEGGTPTLETQALAPLFAENEMDMTGPEIETRLAADTLYVRLFRQAYGEAPITLAGVTKALATYQRTLVSYQSPFDRWAAGELDAFSPAARRGADLFLGEKGDCWHCHAPPFFTNGGFHNIGLDMVPVDIGRALVTGYASDVGKFKTPTLRNVGLTPPYMHDGRFETLREVVEHYNTGGNAHANRDPLMRPLGLSDEEIEDIVAFLAALTDPSFPDHAAP